tara:strand:- start:249 stop:428 length:180 start_codon:yes stop_codon:yes gene_type:complete
MSEQFKNSYVCPECYCADGWNQKQKTLSNHLECKHCQEEVPLTNILEYNKENKGWFRLD